MSPNVLISLRNILVYLYPDDSSIQRVVADSGINVARIKLNSTPENNWYSVLREAEKTGRIEDLLRRVETEYGDNLEFRHACELYRESIGQSSTTNITRRLFINRTGVQFALYFLAALEVGLSLLFFSHKDALLVSTPFYVLMAILTALVVIGWIKLSFSNLRRAFGKGLFLFSFLLTIIWIGLISYSIINSIGLENTHRQTTAIPLKTSPTQLEQSQFLPAKFGIAIAILSKVAGSPVTDTGLEIRDKIYQNLVNRITKYNLQDKVDLKQIGIITDTTIAKNEGERIRSALIIWGRLYEIDHKAQINFQVLETSLAVTDPTIPRAMPSIDPSIDPSLAICVGLGNISQANAQILGLTEYSLGLYYYLNELNPLLAEERFRSAIEAFEIPSASKYLQCDDPKFSLSNVNLGLAYYYLGKSYQLQGEYEKSEEELKQAISYSGGDSAVLLAQAYNYRALGKEQAKQEILKLIHKPSSSTETAHAYNEGLAYETEGDYEAAQAQYSKAITAAHAQNHNFFIGYLSRAHILTMLCCVNKTPTDQARLADAKSDYDEAAKTTDGNPLKEAWLYLGKGQLYENIAQIDEAIKAYSQAIELAPNLVTTYLYRAKLYEKLYKESVEKELPKKEICHQGNLDYANNAGLDYKNLIDRVDAISINPYWAHANFGEFLVSICRYKEAAQQFKIAVEDPRKVEPSVRDFYGISLFNMGDTSGAMAQFTQSISRSLEISGDLSSRARTQLNLGQVYELHKESDKAKAIYESIVVLNGRIEKGLLQIAQERLVALKNATTSQISEKLLPAPTPQR